VAGGTAVAVESAAGVIDAPKARAIDEATGGAGEPNLTYLANAIRSSDRAIPYSLVTAMDLRAVAPLDSRVRWPIVLNEWATRDLGARIGAPIALEYYVWEEPGRLLTRTAEFQLAAIVPIAAAAADRDLAPVYPGISEARRLGDWDPPFPIDLGRIRRQDEDFGTISGRRRKPLSRSRPVDSCGARGLATAHRFAYGPRPANRSTRRAIATRRRSVRASIRWRRTW
jgi:hypothetical protein